MKSFGLAILLTLSTVGSSWASLPSLTCRSYQKIEGWTGVPSFDFVTYEATIAAPNQLKGAHLYGAYASDKRDLVAEADRENKHARTRFGVLEDAWCWFNLLVPKNFSRLEKKFKGTIQYTCEGQHEFSYIDMSCAIESSENK